MTPPDSLYPDFVLALSSLLEKELWAKPTRTLGHRYKASFKGLIPQTISLLSEGGFDCSQFMFGSSRLVALSKDGLSVLKISYINPDPFSLAPSFKQEEEFFAALPVEFRYLFIQNRMVHNSICVQPYAQPDDERLEFCYDEIQAVFSSFGLEDIAGNNIGWRKGYPACFDYEHYRTCSEHFNDSDWRHDLLNKIQLLYFKLDIYKRRFVAK